MKYEDVINVFLSSVKEDDPYKSSKKLQIERWGRLWWGILHMGSRKHLEFVVQVLSDETCWDITSDLYGIKLNVQKIGAKLVSSETIYAGQKNPLHHRERYRVACWCCLEEDIKSLFDQDKQNRRGIDSEKKLIGLVKIHNNGPLMIFWTHYINSCLDKINHKNKNAYVFGFECAMAEKHTEALEFFWGKIKSDIAIPLKQKEELLISTALYYSLNGQASADMIEFCLRHLEPNQYSELLKKDFHKNDSYLTLSQLRLEHCIESAKKLFGCLNPEDISPDKYTVMMFGAIKSTISLPDDYFVSASNDLIVFMLNRPGFEEHRQYFINDLCDDRCSPCRQLMIELIDMNRSGAVWDILNSASLDQIKLIMKSDDFCRFNILTEFVGDKDFVIDKLRSYYNTNGDDINKLSNLLVGSSTQAMATSYTEGSSIAKENIPSLYNFTSSNIVKEVDNVKHYL